MSQPIDNHDSFARNLMHPGAIGCVRIHAMRHDAPEVAPATVLIRLEGCAVTGPVRMRP